MAVPYFQSLMWPLLEELSDDREHSVEDVRDALARQFGLTEEDLGEWLPSGKTKTYVNNVAWAFAHFRRAGLIDQPGKKVYRITVQGQEFLGDIPSAERAERFDLQLLNRFPEYQRSGAQGGDNDKPGNPGSLEWLARELCVPCRWLSGIRELIEEQRQVIFKGPPGTGKTYVARHLARHLAGDPSRVRLVQFHASYTYEDFVQGYRPALVDGAAAFKLVDGPLIEMARQAAADPEHTYVLLIDELNRGNVAKVFGELYFLLEYRDEAVRLQYGATGEQEDFKLPKNLWFIGTMNTADQSIALLDSALRRRFRFVDFYPTEPPISELLRTWLRRHGYGPELDWLADVLDLANRRLADREISVGPSYFLDSERQLTDERIADLWQHAVLPYLEEHFFGEEERRREFTLEVLRRSLDRTPEPEALESGDELAAD